jgi:hypothetical protein
MRIVLQMTLPSRSCSPPDDEAYVHGVSIRAVLAKSFPPGAISGSMLVPHGDI